MNNLSVTLDKNGAVSLFIAFIRSHFPTETCRIHIGILTNDKESVQNRVGMLMLEKLLKLPKAEFVDIIFHLSQSGLVPALLDIFSPGGFPSLSHQMFADLSCFVGLASLMHNDTSGQKRSWTLLATASKLKEKKCDVSIRLKVFRGSKGSSGDGDVGRHGWALVDQCFSQSTQSHDKSTDTL